MTVHKSPTLLVGTGRRLCGAALRCPQRRTLSLVFGFALAAAALACSGAADEGKLPPDVQDPATLKTPSGALARYRGALALLPETFDRFMTLTGIFTDELADLPAPTGAAGTYTPLDSRSSRGELAAALADDYNKLHQLRTDAQEARGFVQAYLPDSAAPLAAHLYALEGYATVFLADLFCSGIPLSSVDFDGDYTFQPGASTTEVYRQAVARFDSALALAGDSARFEHLAAVGRGRALSALGQYAEAAAAVSAVPDDYAYAVVFNPKDYNQRLLWSFWLGEGNGTVPTAAPNMGDQEGGVGLDYRTSGDPRTPAVAVGADAFGQTYWFPAKYPPDFGVTLALASGIEARLIEAEAALQTGSGDWRAMLNRLRTDGTYDTQPNAEDPSRTDTLWHAGAGAVPGLGPLPDPGSEDARVALVFRERAFWLYLTGHRQGDLRRLLRPPYLRPKNGVYPSGAYPGGSGTYGTEVVVPVPQSEQQYNPRYTGCINYGA